MTTSLNRTSKLPQITPPFKEIRDIKGVVRPNFGNLPLLFPYFSLDRSIFVFYSLRDCGRKKMANSSGRHPGGKPLIPRAQITAWRASAPWPSDAQIEQDLILSRAIDEIFNQPAVAQALAFRVGTYWIPGWVTLAEIRVRAESRYSIASKQHPDRDE